MTAPTTTPAATTVPAPAPGADTAPDVDDEFVTTDDLSLNLLYTELEEEVRASVRSVLADLAPWQDVLRRTESDEPTDTALWRTLTVEVGLAGLAVPESLGGAGASWREAAVVLEELGRAVAPVPYLGSSVTATALLLELGDSDLLGQVAAGEVTAAVAVPFSAAPGSGAGSGGGPGVGAGITVRLVDGRLTGTVTSVSDALIADVLLVPTDHGIYAVDPAGAGVGRTPLVSFDMTRPLSTLTFDGAQGRRLAADRDVAVDVVLDRALTIAAALLASEQLGLAERCLTDTVEYLKTRRQFGRVIGSYQALKHRLADLWVQLTQARATARYAAACAAEGDADLPVAAAVAQAVCSAVALRAAEECIQLHGGIGFTWEHPAHLFLKRARTTAIALGTPDRHRATLASLVDLAPPPR